MMKSLLARSEESTSHVLAGNWLPGLDLRIWIWINGPGATFDLEFVFWANSAFPSPDDDDACAATFAELVAFAETRSEERRVGKACVSTCSSRCSPYHKKKK